MLNHEERRKGIGGSDVAVIMWDSRPKLRKKLHLFAHQTPLSLWHYIMNNYRETENACQANGKETESLIIDAYEAHTHLHVERHPSIVDSSNPLLRGNLDALERSIPLPVEAKTGRYRHLWGKPGSQVIPLSYRFQCGHYGGIVGADKVDIGVKFENDDEVRFFYCPRNLKLEMLARETCLEWWEKHIVQKKEPEPINKYDHENLVGLTYVMAPDHILELYEQHKILKAATQNQLKEDKKIKETITEWVKANSKGKINLLLPDETPMGITYFKKGTIDEDAMIAAKIDIDKYRKTKSLVFKLGEKGGKK